MTRRLDSLQALRGVACLAVLLYHLGNIDAGFGLGFRLLGWAERVGFAGVDLFFVLSGCVLTLAARRQFGRPARLPGYLLRRGWRVFPPYWAALGVAAAVGASTATGTPAEWFATLALLPQEQPPALLPVAWSLTYELMFYLGLGLLLLAPPRLAGPVLVGWAGAVLAAAAVGPPAGWRRLPFDPFVLEFLAGCLVAWWPLSLGRRAGWWGTVGAVAWLAGGVAVTWHAAPDWLPTHHWPRVLVVGPPAAAAVFLAVGREHGGGRPWPRWLTVVGDASYAIYLTHTSVLVTVLYYTLLVRWPHNRAGHLAFLVVSAAAAVGFGLLFHRFVERPLLALASRLGRSQPQSGQRPAAGA